MRTAPVITTLVVGGLIVAGTSVAEDAKPRPRVGAIELRLRNDGAVALRLRARQNPTQVFAFRPSNGLVVAASSTPRPQLWRIGPNTHGAASFLNRLRDDIAAGATVSVVAGVRDGAPKRFEVSSFNSVVHGVRCGSRTCWR